MDRFRPAFAVRAALLCGAALLAFTPTAGQNPRIHPVAPNAIDLPTTVRQYGTIRRAVIAGTGERFGKYVAGLGDINNDGLADWIVERVRCDTVTYSPDSSDYGYPEEVLMYKGVRGGIPAASDGIRIGPAEIGAQSMFVAHGDYDGDEHQDIALAIRVFSDTFGGNHIGWPTRRLVIFWGNPDGEFSLEDTTQLQCESAAWLGIVAGLSADLDNDGISDLLIVNGGGLQDGQLRRQAPLRLYRGHRGARWGRSPSVTRSADWTMWTPPPLNSSRTTSLHALDHDCDGRTDIAFYRYAPGEPPVVSVMYGLDGALPDSTAIQSVALTSVSGVHARFADVTGDGAPELLTNSGLQQTIRIYAGRPHQRLVDQFGTGNDDPIPTMGWWRRPWAEIWAPDRLHDGWTGTGFSTFFDFGDFDGDGRSEIWVSSWPFVLGYRAGITVDSLADAWFRYPGGELTGMAVLGDIDGSRRSTVAVGIDNAPRDPTDPYPGAVVFLRADSGIPNGNASNRPLPHLPGESCRPLSSSDLEFTPGPDWSGGVPRMRFDPSSRTLTIFRSLSLSAESFVITVCDVLGRRIAEGDFDSESASATIELLRGTAPFFCVLRSSSSSFAFVVPIGR